MTFREIALGSASRQELSLGLPAGPANLESEKSFFQSIISNQSPVMKFWFVIMVLNLAMFLFIIH